MSPEAGIVHTLGRRPVVVALAAAASLVPFADALVGPGWYLASPLMVLGAAAAGYAVGALAPVRLALPTVLGSAAVLTVANQLDSDAYHWLDDLTFFAVVVGGPALAGAAVVARAGQVRELTRLGRQLEEQRRAEVAAARLEEQNRVQEQVHRQISQRFGAIALRAEGAHHAAGDPDAGPALAELEAVARSALDDLREALGSLREPMGPPAPLAQEVHIAQPKVSLLDLAIAVGCGLAIAVETLLVDTARGPAVANVVAAMAVSAPLAVRRSRPILAAACSLAAGAAMSYWLTPLSDLVTPVALMVALAYAIGAWSHRGWWVAGLLVTWAGMVAVVLTSPGSSGDQDGLVPSLVWTALAVGVGRVTAGWQVRAQRTAATVAALDRGRATQVRVAVARERQSLASSLHDSVAHAMTVVCVQASAGQRATDPAARRNALATIAAAARTGLTELRVGLEALDGAGGPLDRSGIASIARHTGVAADVDVPAGLELHGPLAGLAQRVLREALVNVARHAPGAATSVTVRIIDDMLQLEVRDVGSERDVFTGGTGSGLTGLADAVDAEGGRMEWGPVAGGGFRVAAGLPLARGPLEATR